MTHHSIKDLVKKGRFISAADEISKHHQVGVDDKVVYEFAQRMHDLGVEEDDFANRIELAERVISQHVDIQPSMWRREDLILDADDAEVTYRLPISAEEAFQVNAAVVKEINSNFENSISRFALIMVMPYDNNS